MHDASLCWGLLLHGSVSKSWVHKHTLIKLCLVTKDSPVTQPYVYISECRSVNVTFTRVLFSKNVSNKNALVYAVKSDQEQANKLSQKP